MSNYTDAILTGLSFGAAWAVAESFIKGWKRGGELPRLQREQDLAALVAGATISKVPEAEILNAQFLARGALVVAREIISQSENPAAKTNHD